MPELPEVETIRLGLQKTLPGETVTNVLVQDFVEVLDPPSVEAFRDLLVGQTYDSAQRRGKYLILRFSNQQTLIVHLRMTGQLHLIDSTLPPVRFERASFLFESGRSLRFADQRKFGRIAMAGEGAVEALDQKLGVEPLSTAFAGNYLQNLVKDRKRPVKALILDQHLIAGIGNIYADEALFRAQIHPLRPSGALTEEECNALTESLRHVLRLAITNGGTTFSSYQNAHGESGQNQFSLLVYGKGRANLPCPVCGEILVCIRAGGRSSHFCESCQRPPENLSG